MDALTKSLNLQSLNVLKLLTGHEPNTKAENEALTEAVFGALTDLNIEAILASDGAEREYSHLPNTKFEKHGTKFTLGIAIVAEYISSEAFALFNPTGCFPCGEMEWALQCAFLGLDLKRKSSHEYSTEFFIDRVVAAMTTYIRGLTPDGEPTPEETGFRAAMVCTGSDFELDVYSVPYKKAVTKPKIIRLHVRFTTRLS